MMLTDIDLLEIFADDREPDEVESVNTSNDGVDGRAEPAIDIGVDDDAELEVAEGDASSDLEGDGEGADNGREFASMDEFAEQTDGDNSIHEFSEPTLVYEDSIAVEEVDDASAESFDCKEFDITLPPASPVKPVRRPRKSPPAFDLLG